MYSIFFAILYTISTSLFSFLFWIIVARNYTENDVGLAVSIISLCQMISTFSALGLDIGIIRFYSIKENKAELINFCLSLVGLTSLILSVICLAGLNYWAPSLLFIRSNVFFLLLFLLITLFSSMYLVQARIFIASRNVSLSLYLNTLFNVIKLPIPLFLISFGLIAIIFSWTISLFIAIIIGFFWFVAKINVGFKLQFLIKKTLLKELLPYSFGNYVAGVFGSLPVTAIPLIILSILGSENAAFFYMAYSLGSILSFISNSVTTSLFTEGSYNPDTISQHVHESIKFIFILLIPAIIILLLFGNILLQFIGKSYSNNASVLLLLIGISSFPYSIIQIYQTILRIQMNVRYVIYINAILFVLLTGGSYFLMGMYGLMGIGIAWIMSYSIMTVVLLVRLNPIWLFKL